MAKPEEMWPELHDNFEFSEKGRAWVTRAAELAVEGYSDRDALEVLREEFGDFYGLFQERP